MLVDFLRNGWSCGKLKCKLTKLKGKVVASLIPTTSIGLSVSLSIFLLSLKTDFNQLFNQLIATKHQNLNFENEKSVDLPGFIATAWVSISFSWSCLNFIFEIDVWFLFNFRKTGHLLNRCLLMTLSCCWYLKIQSVECHSNMQSMLITHAGHEC